MWILWTTLALAEEPLHTLHAGVAVRGLVPTDRLPTDFELGGAGDWSPARIQPTLTLANTTLWGHAELWVRFTPWSGVPLWGGVDGFTQTTTNVRMEAGGRVYLKKLQDGGTAPFLSVGVAPVSYRSEGGPTVSQPRLEHAIGVAAHRGDWMFSGSLGWAPFASTRYPLGRDSTNQFFDTTGTTYGPSPVLLHVGASKTFGHTAATPRTDGDIQPTLIVGFGGARTIGNVRDRSDQPRSFVNRPAPPGLYPEIGVGLQVGRSVGLQLTYRHIRQKQEAFGLTQTWRRDGIAAMAHFEIPHGLGHAHPYVGAGVALDLMAFEDIDFGIVDRAESVRLGPIAEVGLAYRPTDLEWLRLRTSLRFTALAYAYTDEREIPFQHLEFTMLSAEVTPRRWR